MIPDLTDPYYRLALAVVQAQTQQDEDEDEGIEASED